MALRSYDATNAVQPVGFSNIGFTCYYNSLLQSLLSCTSFVEKLSDFSEKKDNLAKLLSYMVGNFRKLEAGQDAAATEEIERLGPITWRAMIQKLAVKSPEFAQFAVGQQCAAEGFSLLLQALEAYGDIQMLFTHRRRNKIFCPDCKTYFSQVDETNNLFEVEPFTESKEVLTDLNHFLLSQQNKVDADCICSKCGIKSEKLRTSTLVMIPEILFVMSKKYKYNKDQHQGEKIDVYTEFPATLKFAAKDKSEFCYGAVAQIEHHGGLNGGHYYAICKRRNGWFCLNDLAVSPAEFRPTANTYIVVYHIM
jgi:ubiquitin C-terminal hydrolase